MGRDLVIDELTSFKNMFQSTRPHGARPPRFRVLLRPLLFQSTRPHGARPLCTRSFTRLWSFNPRAHMGCDVVSVLFVVPFSVSIHALTWGATAASDGSRFLMLFQSTRPHGARLVRKKVKLNRIKFQSTRPHGARRYIVYFLENKVFIHFVLRTSFLSNVIFTSIINLTP